MVKESQGKKEKTFKRTKCHIWTRGMGYYRPTSAFNIGKLSEFKERVFFNFNTVISKIFNKKEK